MIENLLSLLEAFVTVAVAVAAAAFAAVAAVAAVALEPGFSPHLYPHHSHWPLFLPLDKPDDVEKWSAELF